MKLVDEALEDLKRQNDDLLKINEGIIKANRRMFETIESIKNGEYYSKLKNKIYNLEEDLRTLRQIDSYHVSQILELKKEMKK